MDRCALFVDAGYLLADGAMAVHGTTSRESVSWDYPGVLQFLGNMARDRTSLPLLRCYWYEATMDGRRLPEHDALADLPGVKLRLARRQAGCRGGVEAEMHRDLSTLARNRAVSDALVISADEELTPVVEDVQDLGMRVTIVHITVGGNWTISRMLRQECDGILEIGEAHLRPYVELVFGAEPLRPDERRGGAYPRAVSNGHAPIGPLAGQPALPPGAHPSPPAIYTAPVIAEYQRAAQPLNGPPLGMPASELPARGEGAAPAQRQPQHGAGQHGAGQHAAGQHAAAPHPPPSPQSVPPQHTHPQTPSHVQPQGPAQPQGQPHQPLARGGQQQPRPQHALSQPQSGPGQQTVERQAADPGAQGAPGAHLQAAQHSMPDSPHGRPDQQSGYPPVGAPAPSTQAQFAPHPGSQGYGSLDYASAAQPPRPQPGGVGGQAGRTPDPASRPGSGAAPPGGGPAGPPGMPQMTGPQPVQHNAAATGQAYPAPAAAGGPQSGPPPRIPAPGQMGPGQMGPGQMGPGQMGPGQMAPGQMAPGQGVHSQMAPGQMAPGQAGPGQAVQPGVPAQGPMPAQPAHARSGSHAQPMPGQPMPGQPAAHPQPALGEQQAPPGHRASQPAYPAPPISAGFRAGGEESGAAQVPVGARHPAPAGHSGPLMNGPGQSGAGSAAQPPQSAPRPYPQVAGSRFGPAADQYPGTAPAQTAEGSGGAYVPAQAPYSGPQPAAHHAPVPPPVAVSLADAVQAAHREGFQFGQAVARDAPALWLEAVLARKPRMPSDLEARLLQDSALPIDSLLHDEVRHALRRGFWDALERPQH